MKILAAVLLVFVELLIFTAVSCVRFDRYLQFSVYLLAAGQVAPALAASYGASNKPLLCRFCNMEFDRRTNLVEHVADWCGNLNKPFHPSDVYVTSASAVRTMAAEESSNTSANQSFAFDFEGDGKTYK